MTLALVLSGLLSAAVPAVACDRADLDELFKHAGKRNQGNVGSCAAFAVVAGLEAAILRRHDQVVRLSEWDLFIRNHVLGDSFYSPAVLTIDDLQRAGEDHFIGEGKMPLSDIRFAIENGVATADALDAAKLLSRWEKWKASELDAMRSMKDDWAQAGARERFKAELDPMSEYRNSAEDWARLRRRPEDRAVTERLLLAAPLAKESSSDGLKTTTNERFRRIEESRERVRRLLEGTTVEPAEFPTEETVATLGPEGCRARAAERRDFIRRHLCEGRPVIVSMDLAGLGDWGGGGPGAGDKHAFVITGFATWKEGESGPSYAKPGDATYFTRNSWGDHARQLEEIELCGVYRAAAVIPPGAPR